MSVLTKLFITLHVVVSLLLTAGLVVFVNKTEDFTSKVKLETAAKERAVTRALAAEQEAVAIRGNRDLQVQQALSSVGPYRQALETKTAEVAGLQTQLASEQSARAKADTEKASADAATQGVLASQTVQQKVIIETQAKLTTVEKLYAESQTSIAKVTQEVDGAKAALRRSREEIAALTEKLDKVQSGARAMAGGAQNVAPGMGVPNALLNLHGQIKTKRKINDVDYATITLGSADSVTKGMKFRVVDRNTFLGYLTIDSVEANEAVGHLTGPNLQMVVPGSQVLTQY